MTRRSIGYWAMLAAVPCSIQLAAAADLPAAVPVYKAPPPVATYNWTGFYIGGNLGYGWGNGDVDRSPNDPAVACFFGILFDCGTLTPPTPFNWSGALGGVQFGYNWQFNRNWLVGIETDFDWSGVKGSAIGPLSIAGGAATATVTDSERVDWFGTLRARLGVLPADDLLVFATGGLAYGRVGHTESLANNTRVTFGSFEPPFSISCIAFTTCFAASESGVTAGWTAGTGLEYALSKNVTVKAEYLYVSLGRRPLTETAAAVSPPGTTPGSFNANLSNTAFSVGRVGFNLRF